MALPSFLIKRVPKHKNMQAIRGLLQDAALHTVCESAKCPNIGECFARNTLTFMILGEVCTRSCRFCGVSKGSPLPPDPTEPKRVAEAVKKLRLNYVVITSVTRDDLKDGGASLFAATINECQISNIELRIEVLIPDFKGNMDLLQIVLDANPFVLNHNIETVPRLYSKVRPQADYKRSLNLIRIAKRRRPDIYLKSGFMVGLGEEKAEISKVLEDLKEAGCDIVTIGQYLPPSREHLKPERYVLPEEFEEFQNFEGLKVIAGPFIRSSYRAGEIV